MGNFLYSINELCDLWNKLGDIPVCENGMKIDEPFLHFEKGSDVLEIWHWFEKQDHRFIVGDVGGMIGQDHPYRKMDEKQKNVDKYEQTPSL